MELRLGSSGQLIRLRADAELGSGGEARVFALPNNPHLVAKVYKNPQNSNASKLAAMLANPPDDPMSSQGHASIAWPVDLLWLVGANARVAGFVMPRIMGLRSIIDFYNPKTRRNSFPLFHYGYLIRTARNLAAAFRALHARGYVIGDVNESNILVAATSLVTVIDTDSFQVADPASGTIYRCNVGRPEFTPPELQGHTFSQVNRTPDHDEFGLAVLIFQLLMEGAHPFAGVYLGGGEPPKIEDRIKNGHFPYSKTTTVPYKPLPISPPFEALPLPVQDLFRRCFEDGQISPASRPDAITWQSTLDTVESNLEICSKNAQHLFSDHQGNCPWCERKAQLGGRDPFPSPKDLKQGLHQKPLPPVGGGTSILATPNIVQYQPVQPGISINWKMAIGAACLAMLILMAYTIKKSTEPTGSKVPDGRLPVGKLATAGPQADATPSNIQKLEPADAAERIASTVIYTAGQTFRDCAECPEMVAIPAGSFEMGSNDGGRDERPVHRVGVPAFALAKTEVTQGQWRNLMGGDPSHFNPCGDGCPMEKVSWQDAQDFVQRLSATTGEPYRLPSEAEWEYSCRAGGRQTYCGSDNLDSVAWYGKIRNVSSGGNYPYAVGQKQANAFGLYDMSGNIWEWVEDCYHTSYVGAPTDGSAWISGCSGDSRVMRGGSWLNGPGSARPAYRIVTPPADRVDAKGFRPARMLPTVSTQRQQSEQESALPDRLEVENQGLTNSSEQSSVPTPLPADPPTVRCILSTGANTRISRTECRDRSGVIFDGE